MRILRNVAVLLALAALAVAVFFFARTQDIEAPALDGDAPPPSIKVEKDPGLSGNLPPQGGVYGGIVTNREGQPIPGATVMLAALNTGEFLIDQRRRGDELDPFSGPIPEIGGHELGGAETKTDIDGRWTIPANSRARVTHVLAYHHEHFLSVVAVQGPSDSVRIVLDRGGRVKGEIVDDVTGRPVPGVVVDVYLQQPVVLPEHRESDAGGARKGRRGVKVPESQIARLSRFVAKELGERVWGLPYQGRESLRLRADAQGRFNIGPFGPGVQLEFVLTHDDYRWRDYDKGPKEDRMPQRTIVGPGEVVEREFRMQAGGKITGTLTMADGTPIADAAVSFESITQIYRHWYDANGRRRRTKTDTKGRFEMGGLAPGDHNLMFQHNSFGTHFVGGVRVGSKLEEVIRARGRAVLTLAGLEGRPPRGKVRITLEPTGPKPTEQDNFVAKPFTLGRRSTVVMDYLREGTYTLYVQAGRQASQPLDVEVVAGQPLVETLVMGGGGQLELRILDPLNHIVDPAVAELELIREGKKPRRLGRYVSRGGWIKTNHLAPGTYRAIVTSPGYQPATSENFEVVDGQMSHGGDVTLKPYSYIRLGSVMTAERKAPTGSVVIEYRVGDEKASWKRFKSQGAFDLPIEAGALAVRARTETDLAWNATYDAVGGEVVEIHVVLE